MSKTIDLKEKFFFAEGDSAYYDDTIELATPCYQFMHDTMINILRHHFQLHFGDSSKEIKGIMLDIGAGTGMESISAMDAFPNMYALAIDLCAPMKNLFEQNYLAKFGNNSEKRFRYIVDDILSIDKEDKRLQSYFQSLNQAACKAVISAHCIHHFSLEEKNTTYQKMYDLLEPGGILINIDVFTYESERIKQDAHNVDINYIKNEFDNPRCADGNKIPKISKEQRELLKNKWIEHMETAHCLETVEQRIDLLRKMGFTEVECIFRYWQQCVLRATKP